PAGAVGEQREPREHVASGVLDERLAEKTRSRALESVRRGGRRGPVHRPERVAHRVIEPARREVRAARRGRGDLDAQRAKRVVGSLETGKRLLPVPPEDEDPFGLAAKGLEPWPELVAPLAEH